MSKFLALIFCLLAGSALAQQQLAYPLNQLAIPEQSSADGSGSFIFAPSGIPPGIAKSLYSLTVKTGASAGYVLVFDATALPANGAVTSCTNNSTARPCLLYCAPVAATGVLTLQWMSPMLSQTGIVTVFSTTGCDTLTVSATAKFMGQTL